MENKDQVDEFVKQIDFERQNDNEQFNNDNENYAQNTDANFNYDVYNGLNLLNEDLGQSYIMEGFNPFDNDFALDENFILDVLENNVEKYEISTPDFIEAGNKETAKAFELAAENALKVIELLTEHINDPKTPEIIKKQMRKQILYILCRNQLIKVYLKRIKDEKDTLMMYQKMSAINWQLSKTLQDSYKNKFDAKRAAEELAKKAKEAAESQAEKQEELKNRANKILENNKIFDRKSPVFESFENFKRQMEKVGKAEPIKEHPHKHIDKTPHFRKGESFIKDFAHRRNIENTKRGHSFIDGRDM